MGLVGNLEDLGLGDILQIVSLSRKSGLLSLNWGEVEGKIIFKDGQVVAASSSSDSRTISSVLAERKVASADQVGAIEELAKSSADAASAHASLADKLGLSAAKIEDAVRDKIESTVFDFFTWPEGTFSFELQEIDAEIGGLGYPDSVFVLEMGLSPQFLAMEGTRLQDERRRDEAPVGPPIRGPSSFEPPPRPSALEEEPIFKTSGTAPAAAGSSPLPEAEEDFSSVAEALQRYKDEPASPSPADDGDESSPVESAYDEIDASGEVEEVVRGTAAEDEYAPEPPIEPEAAAEPAPPPEGPVTSREPAGGDHSIELVVVDDDPVLIRRVGSHLVPKGYKVIGFDSVAAAVKHVQEEVDLGEKPTVVLADLIMPDSRGESTLGGLEMLEQTRKTNPAISVYVMTDYENKPAREKARELGARFFFMKPKSSQIEEDEDTPELVNFVQVLDDALGTEPKKKAAEKAPDKAAESGMINLGEELRREFGEEVIPEKAQPAEQVRPSRGLFMLKSMISELNDPQSSGQITLMILRFAAEIMNRSVIFLVAKNQIAGLGQFGIEIDGIDPQKHVRKIRIPLKEPSIFREAIQKRLPLKKSLKKNKWHEYLVKSLGGVLPNEVFVAPIIAGGKIAAILYGDNVPEDKEIGDTESLEIFLAQAGLAMEKALLERKLREMGSPPEGLAENS